MSEKKRGTLGRKFSIRLETKKEMDFNRSVTNQRLYLSSRRKRIGPKSGNNHRPLLDWWSIATQPIGLVFSSPPLCSSGIKSGWMKKNGLGLVKKWRVTNPGVFQVQQTLRSKQRHKKKLPIAFPAEDKDFPTSCASQQYVVPGRLSFGR